MAKKFLTCLAFLLIALCSSAFAEGPHLVTIHETVVENIFSQDMSAWEGNVKVKDTDFLTVGVSYDTAKFFCVTLEIVSDDDEMPHIETFCPPSISFDLSGGKYSFWNSYTVEDVDNTPKTFLTARTESLVHVEEEPTRWGVNRFAYVPTNSEGDWVHFLNDAETGLKDVTVTWRYPEYYSNESRTAKVPQLKTTAEQLADFVPTIEYKTSGSMGAGDLTITGIEWKFVKSSDVTNAITSTQDIHFEIVSLFGENNDMDKSDKIVSFDIKAGDLASGKAENLSYRGVPWCTIVRYYIGEDKNTVYQWRFISVNVAIAGRKIVRPSAYNGGTAIFQAGLTDGKSDYTYARYDNTSVVDIAMWPVPNIIEAKHLADQLTFTIHGGGTFTILDADGEVFRTFNSPDVDITLPLRTRTPFGNSYIEFGYMTEGYRKEHWTYINDAYHNRSTLFRDETGSLNGKEVSWKFKNLSEFDGKGKIASATSLVKQYDKSTGGFFPYVELVSEDGYVTAVNYRLVQSPDITTPYNPEDLSVLITMDVQTEHGATWDIPNGTLSNATFPPDDGSRTTWKSEFKTSGTLTLKEKIRLGEYTAVNVFLRVFHLPYNENNYYGDSYYGYRETQEGVTYGALSDGDYINNRENYDSYTWRFIDEPPAAETHIMSNEDIETVSEDKLAEALGVVSGEEFNFTERQNLYDETKTTPEALKYFEGHDSEMVGRFKQLYGRKPGWYVTRVTLPPELYDLIHGLSADVLKVYALTDSVLHSQGQQEEVPNVAVASLASVRLAADDEPKTGSLVALDGSKVDKIEGHEFLMVSYLDSPGEKSNMYLGLNNKIEVPDTPDSPDVPVTPASPDKPASPDVPVNPVSPDKPASPDVPVNPVSPDTPVVSPDNGGGNTKPTVDDKGELNLNGGTSLKDAIDELVKSGNAESVTSIPAEAAKDITEINAETFEKLTGLKSVDLSKATNLTVIVLGSNSSITEIKLGEENSQLTEINIAGSNVQRLDAANCEGVKNVDLRYCEQLQYADLSSADISSLDLTGCKNIQTLKVGDCKIYTITGLEDCAKTLTELNVKGNSILFLDLSNFEKLTDPASIDLSGQKRGGWIAKSIIRWAEFFAGDENIFKTADADNYADKIKITSPADGFTQDEEGNVTFTTVPESFSYVYEAKKDVASMDVTISGESLDDENAGGSGGGCNLVRSEELGVRSVLLFALCLLCLIEVTRLKFRR